MWLNNYSIMYNLLTILSEHGLWLDGLWFDYDMYLIRIWLNIYKLTLGQLSCLQTCNIFCGYFDELRKLHQFN